MISSISGCISRRSESFGSPMNALLTPSKTLRIDVLPQLGGDGKPFASAADTINDKASPIRPDEFYRFFETAYDASLITDADGTFVTANRRVTDLLGYTSDDLHHASIWQLISGADAGIVDTVCASLASARFVRLSAWCVRKNGTAFPAVIAVNRFVSDQHTFFCFFIRDETLRTQAEEQLRTIKNAVENADTGIGVAGLDGALLYGNPALAALCGESSPEKIAGRKLDELLGDATVALQLTQAVQDGRGAFVELPLLHPTDGSQRWIQVSAAPNLNSDDALIGMVLSLVDISDRHRAEEAERVVERDRVMMESIGAVCHHLGQPATVLLSSLEMLTRERTPDAETRAELLKMSLEAAEALRTTLQELNEVRHYDAEPYPAGQSARIVSVQPPPANSPETMFR